VGVLAVVLVAAAVGLAGWAAATGSGPTTAASAAPVNPNQSLTSFGGQFLASCPYSHTRPDDPIVHMGMPGMSHLHEFFGNDTTDAATTFASLRRGSSTCSEAGDRSGYWVPALYVGAKRVPPVRVDAYYRVPNGVKPAAVRPFPDGLEALAGNQHATATQSLDVVAWTCGLSPDLTTSPPSTCGPDRPLQLRLTFPSCWDGHHAASADHVSHLAYPTAAGCPGSHPVPIPQLTLAVHYPVYGKLGEVHLASGSTVTAHGDFFDGWDPARLRAQVAGCLNRDVTCGIVGGTFHTGPGSGDRDTYNLPAYSGDES
jgi:hypothetical protein